MVKFRYLKNKYFLLFVLLFFKLIISAQTFYSKNYTVEDGLGQSQVNSLFQDNQGKLWIGTVGGGVSIYNGNKFTSLNKDNGLAGNIIYSITQDSLNNIILGTENGLSVYNGFCFKNYSVNEGLPNKRVFSVAVDKFNKIWIGTERGVAILYKNKIQKFNNNEILNSTGVYVVYPDKDNNIWFGTKGNGLVLFSKDKFSVFTEKDSLCSNTIRSIVQDNNGTIWIGSEWVIMEEKNGLNWYKNGKLSIFKKNALTYYNSTKLKDGKICFAIFQGSLAIYYYKNNQIEKEIYKFSDKSFLSVIQDREGTIWIGTSTGLIKFPQNIFYNYSEKEKLHNNNIYSILVSDKNDVWIGAFSEGLSRLKNNTFFYYPKTKDNNGIIGGSVFSICEDNNKNIWFGTWDGISVFNPKDSSFTNFSSAFIDKNKQSKSNKSIKQKTKVSNKEVVKKNNIKTTFIVDSNITNNQVNSIILDRNNTIWIGTNYNGITRYYNNSFEDFNLKFPILIGKSILKIFEDKKVRDRYFFTSNNGVYYYDGKTVVHLTKKNGFTDEEVCSVEEDNEGNYWFGTKEGLYRCDLNNFEKIDTKKGLSSNNIYLLILDDHDNLFVGTEKGLDRVNTQLYNKNKEISIRKYSSINGFIGQECNRNACFKDKSGNIWFGTVKGVTVYDPTYDSVNYVKPITYISDIKLNYKNFNYFDYSDGIDSLTKLPLNLSLPHYKNHLTFTFFSTSYTVPEKVQYQYMLEPLEKEWSPPFSKNEVDYPVLPPGKYTLNIRACNNDGIWNDVPTIFNFEIKPPFWFTWWGITLEIIFGLFIVYFYIQYREAALLKEKKILEQKVKERTIEIQEQKEIVEQKNKDITDSINYAKNIQEAILPHIKDIVIKFPESFILFKPRDIVSGDFYWLANKNGYTYIAVADCTGHGVPGAFMSMLGIALLNEIINMNEKINVGNILDKLRENVINSLHQTGETGKSKDGMDITLCMIDWKEKQIHIATANNPLYLIRNNEVIEIKGDKMPIGYSIRMDNFTDNIINIKYNDCIYLFSDGYADQFGGPNGKKFKYSQLKELLVRINKFPMDNQKVILENTINEWKKDSFQVDDILMLGIKFDHPQFET